MNTPTSTRFPALLSLLSSLPLLIGFLILSSSVSVAQVRTSIGGYEVSGPYHYKNLSVFLIHGKDQFSGRKIITLEEGLAQGIVKVYETGSVNQLEIENLSNDTEIYIQAGDIVKGGRQDRTLGIDLTLAPNSGRVPIASFCVERGRWTQRGSESSAEFNSSTSAVTSNSLRFAIKSSKNQSEVWENVGVMQEKLSMNVGVMVNAVGARVPVVAPQTEGESDSLLLTDPPYALISLNQDAGRGMDERIVVNESILASEIAVGAVQTTELPEVQALTNSGIVNVADNAITTDEIISQQIVEADNQQSAVYRIRPALSVRGGRSAGGFAEGGVVTTTSLQLSLENAELIDEVEEYMAALQKIVSEHDDVIGFAFTINGEMKNADIYGSSDLFGRLWPKLLRAAATEAVSEQKGEEGQIGSIDAVRRCFSDAENAAAEQEEVDDRIILVTRQSEENVLFETQEKGEDEWLHRNYMKLE